MRDLHPPFFFPFYFFIPFFFLILSKGIFESTAKLTYLGKTSNCFRMLYLQFCQNCVIAVIHYWLHRLFSRVLKWPTFILNDLFMCSYLIILGFSVYDYENTRHNMQLVLPSTYVAYLGRQGMEQKHFHPFWSNLKGTTARSNSVSNIIKTTILDSPGFWILIVTVLLSFLLLSIFLSYLYWDRIVDSFLPTKFIKEEDKLRNELQNQTQVWFFNNQRENSSEFNFTFVLIHTLAAFDIFFVLYAHLCDADFKAKYFSIMPYFSSMVLALSHFESNPSKYTKDNVVNITRNYLPPNRYWLDTREPPIYPEVHGDLKSFCSYNPQSKLCLNQATVLEIQNQPVERPKILSFEHNKNTEEKNSQTEQKKDEFLTPEEMPNVILMLYESFNPFSYLINPDFLQEHVKNPHSLQSELPFYNEKIMPFLTKFSKEEMITFSGMQTLGLPSFSGLHSILTQEPPSQSYMNIINGWQNHVDDIPSLFHSKGYRTLILNANRFDFDGKQYWIYKKPAREEAAFRLNCLSSYGDSFNDSLQRKIGDYSMVPNMKKECTEKDIDNYLKTHDDVYDFPRWFDYAAAYYPTQSQAKSIGLDPSSVFEHPAVSVSGDRIVARQVEVHWQQQKDILKNKGEHRPIFTLVSSVDGHMPYSGYDQQRFYPHINMNMKPYSEEFRVKKFLRVNTYTDKYFIEEIINWLRENDPNTILLFTGDHGTRDIPAKEKNEELFKGVKYDEKCIHESTGSDSLFLVTGGMAYLGKDERIKKAFALDKLAGKTFKYTVDHGDMIYTCEEILARLQGKTLDPTNRKSRNLVDLSLDLLETNDDKKFAEKIDKSGWRSISMVSHMIEYHNGMRMTRFHPGDIQGAHIYKHCVYPTGLLKTDFDESKDKREFEVLRELDSKSQQYKDDYEFIQEALSYMAAENYLSIENRLYNYKFRNEECKGEKKCELPHALPPLSFEDYLFIWFIIRTYFKVVFGFMVPVVIGACVRIIFIYTKSKKNEDKNDLESLIQDPSA